MITYGVTNITSTKHTFQNVAQFLWLIQLILFLGLIVDSFFRMAASMISISEQEAIWLLGNLLLGHHVAKFLRIRYWYPELSRFKMMKYQFENIIQLQDVQH